MNEIDRIRKIALDLLAHREHSRLELYTKLKQHQFASSLIETVLNELIGNGLQNDERFTEIYVNSRMNRGYGPIRIRLELQHRGIKDDLIANYINDSDEIWYKIASTLCYKRFGRRPLKFKEQAKQMNFLKYRGFTSDQIHAIFKDLAQASPVNIGE